MSLHYHYFFTVANLAGGECAGTKNYLHHVSGAASREIVPSGVQKYTYFPLLCVTGQYMRDLSSVLGAHHKNPCLL